MFTSNILCQQLTQYHRIIIALHNIIIMLTRNFRRALQFIKKPPTLTFLTFFTFLNRNRSSKTTRLGLLLSSLALYRCTRIQISCEQQQKQAQAQQLIPHIIELNKQSCTELLGNSNQEQFLLVIYDKFMRNDEESFEAQLQLIVEECRALKIDSLYLIQDRQVRYLEKLEKVLQSKQGESKPISNQGEGKPISKPFDLYYKNSHFNSPFQIKAKPKQIPKQVIQIRNIQISQNSPSLITELSSLTNPNTSFDPRTLVIKHCVTGGQCIESFKDQVKYIYDEGLLEGKTKQFRFHAVKDQWVGMLGSPSEYIKNVNKEMQSVSSSHSVVKKEQILMVRRDIIGLECRAYSERQWQVYQKQGFNNWVMFLMPRIHVISKSSYFTDLMWYVMSMRRNSQPSISYNNTDLSYLNSQQKVDGTLNIFRMLYESYPLLNYLVINSMEVGQLLRHVECRPKWFIFNLNQFHITPKKALELDHTMNLPEQAAKEQFGLKVKPQIEEFIKDPNTNHYYLNVNKQHQINILKLKQLLIAKKHAKNPLNYLIRVCKGKCRNDVPSDKIKQLNSKKLDGLRVYWVDSTAQNVGLEDGDYLLSDGDTLQLL